MLTTGQWGLLQSPINVEVLHSSLLQSWLSGSRYHYRRRGTHEPDHWSTLTCSPTEYSNSCNHLFVHTYHPLLQPLYNLQSPIPVFSSQLFLELVSWLGAYSDPFGWTVFSLLPPFWRHVTCMFYRLKLWNWDLATWMLLRELNMKINCVLIKMTIFTGPSRREFFVVLEFRIFLKEVVENLVLRYFFTGSEPVGRTYKQSKWASRQLSCLNRTVIIV